jgi:FMN phosphatase YigB (HAD superfamily)
VIDLVCWDFGDTLVDEMFMRNAPDGVSGWADAYERALMVRPGFVDEWMLGRAALNELVDPLASELPMSPVEVSRHLRAVWSTIEWYPEVRRWLVRLQGNVPQAIVTVNPWEFEGIAVACGLVPLFDVIVTSAELQTLSKVTMAERARELLGLTPGLATTLLIDNKQANTDEFDAAGGQTFHFTRERFGAEADSLFVDVV